LSSQSRAREREREIERGMSYKWCVGIVDGGDEEMFMRAELIMDDDE
jgi:hypothetical protein